MSKHVVFSLVEVIRNRRYHSPGEMAVLDRPGAAHEMARKAIDQLEHPCTIPLFSRRWVSTNRARVGLRNSFLCFLFPFFYSLSAEPSHLFYQFF